MAKKAKAKKRTVKRKKATVKRSGSEEVDSKTKPAAEKTDVVDMTVELAYERLNGIYESAIADEDMQTALQAQREINRVMSLYGEDKGSGSDGVAGEYQKQIEMIASYLLPLQLLTDNYPIEEHARVAAEKIRNSGL